MEFDQIDDIISISSIGLKLGFFSSIIPTSNYSMSVLPIDSLHSNIINATYVLKSLNGEFFSLHR